MGIGEPLGRRSQSRRWASEDLAGQALEGGARKKFWRKPGVGRARIWLGRGLREAPARSFGGSLALAERASS